MSSDTTSAVVQYCRTAVVQKWTFMKRAVSLLVQ